MSAAQPMSVADALNSRKSVRAFLPTPVSREQVERLLALAARAPSGTNIQPWKVDVLTGAPLADLCARIQAAYDDPATRAEHVSEYDYYPTEFFPPYIDRRRKVGWDLYSLLNIAKGDKARMHQQHRRNFAFFDAPVGLFFRVDRRMGRGSWLDFGMFLQALMTAARGDGLDTCPQAAFTDYHRLIADALKWPETDMLVCGMALGHADPAAPENQLVTERAPVGEFTAFHGWDAA